jgi:cathepsin C
VSQGDCGSCYAISTIHMLTARNRIKVKDTNEPAFSVTFPLRCSEYNQGCNGGYGFLESKWAEDVGLVPEQCSPFSDDADAVCQALQDCDLGDRRYRAVNHRYVGGFYGGSDHEHIQRELVTNGPLVLSFEPKEDFMYYKAGLYRSGSNKIHQEWEQVDHAVLLIGMGQESGQPYWTMQNSWGSEWGEQGYFRMARGIDESGCESIAVAADVEQDSSNQVLDDFLNSL